MGRRTLPGQLSRRIRDLQLEQEAGGRRGRTLFGKWDSGEVGRLHKLIRGIFGDSGVIEVDQHDPGKLRAGRFTDGLNPKPGTLLGPARPTEWFFEGRCLSDFEAQIAVFRAHR